MISSQVHCTENFGVSPLSMSSIVSQMSITEYLQQVAKVIKTEVISDKSIWKWCAIFTSLCLGSRFIFYKLYYPRLLRTFSPPSFFTSSFNSNSINNKQAKNMISHQSSISNAFPVSLLRRLSVQPLHTESLYSSNTRWQNSLKASGKLMSLTHAILTVYKGFNVMKSLNITQESVAKGVDYRQPPIITKENSLVLDMVNMNTSYALIDLLLIYLPSPKGQSTYIIHHSMVILAGVLLKMFNEGAPIWLITYSYSDIPTIILHSLWFFRNIGGNLKAIRKLFMKQSVKESQYINNKDVDNLDVEIDANLKRIGKIEKVLFLGFSASFFYVRLYVFSKVIPLWLFNSLGSDRWSNDSKVVASGVISVLLGVGYLWSFKLVLKIKEVLANDGDEKPIQQIEHKRLESLEE